MPIYNVEKYIERALLSALNQTYQNLEILIVDDLGHDNSMNIVHQLKNTHPRGNCIRIVTHKKNLGLGGTRNTAIELAHGEYLYFMDSDDAIVPDCIETLYNIMSQEKVDFVAAGINQIDENGDSLEITSYPNITRKGKLCMAQYFYEEKNDIWVTTWNKLYNLSFLKEFHIHFLDHVYHEDIAMHAMLALKTRSFALSNRATYLYNCKRENSITNMQRGYTLKHLNDLTIVFSEIRRMVQLDNNLSKHLRKEINLYYLFEIYNRYIPAMYSNIKRVDLINGLVRLSQNGIPSILEIRLTPKSIKRSLFLKLPFSIQYLIKSHKYKKSKILASKN